jgi:hypothetical protein
MSQILPNVHMVDASKGANVYLIIDNGVTLIDTGVGKNTPNVLAKLRKLGYESKMSRTSSSRTPILTIISAWRSSRKEIMLGS